MTHKHKLVKDVDDEIWRKFIAYCKLKNVKVSEGLNDVLEEYLKKNLKKLFSK